MHIRVVLRAALAAGILGGASTASAAVIGSFNVANLPAGGVIITANSIDFVAPIGGGVGEIATGLGSFVAYAGGPPLVPGVPGLARDLTVPAAVPVIDFMTFAVSPNLHFDLLALGPGSPNPVLAPVLDPSLPAGSLPGSPFVLTPTATGTSISFSVSGVARDLSPDLTVWSGEFTTQVPGLTPLQVGQTLLGGGSIISTESGSFTVQVPEPATLGVLALGGVALLLRRRRAA